MRRAFSWDTAEPPPGTFQKLGHNCWVDLGFAEDVGDFPLLCFSLSAGRRDILGQFLSGKNDKDSNLA